MNQNNVNEGRTPFQYAVINPCVGKIWRVLDILSFEFVVTKLYTKSILKLFGWTYIIILIEIRERVNEDVRVYFCPGSSEKMGHFRKTGTEAMRGKPYTRRGKI